MLHISAAPAQSGCETKAAALVEAIEAAVADERAAWFWQVRRRNIARTRRRRLVNHLRDYFDLPAGGCVEVPSEWLA